MVVGARLINRLIDVLKSGVEDTLISFLKDFVTEGTKSKSKISRQSAWYAKYRATIPGLAGLLKDLSKSDSTTIISLLSQEWSSSLVAFHSESTSVNSLNISSIGFQVRKLQEDSLPNYHGECEKVVRHDNRRYIQ